MSERPTHDSLGRRRPAPRPAPPGATTAHDDPALWLLAAVVELAQRDARDGSYEAQRFLTHLAEAVRPATPPQRHADAPGALW